MSIRCSYDSRIMSFWKSSFNFIIQPELDQHQILDSLTSYPIPKIELEVECEPDLQFSDLSLILESISTPVVLPKLSNILELILIPIPELESTISPIHIPSVDENQDSIFLHPFELALNFENYLDILASYPFPENVL